MFTPLLVQVTLAPVHESTATAPPWLASHVLKAVLIAVRLPQEVEDPEAGVVMLGAVESTTVNWAAVVLVLPHPSVAVKV